VSGTSAHATFNEYIFDTGIPYFPVMLQIMCTPSHTILRREGQTIGAGVLRKGEGMRFGFVSFLKNATMISLVELSGRAAPASETEQAGSSSNHSLTDYEGEYTHGS
jgi:hypothetical protein